MFYYALILDFVHAQILARRKKNVREIINATIIN